MLKLIDRLRNDERGVAMIVAMFAVVMMAGAVLTVAVSVNGDTPLGKRDLSRKEATTDATSVLNLYLEALSQNSAYWRTCHPTGGTYPDSMDAAINVSAGTTFWSGSGNGTESDTRHWYQDASGSFRYTIEVLLPSGATNTCGSDSLLTGDQPATLNVRVSAQSLRDGSTTGPVRMVRAILGSSSLTDYLWVTNYETLAPALMESTPGYASAYTEIESDKPTGGGAAGAETISTWAQQNCSKYAYTTTGGLRSALTPSTTILRRSAASSSSYTKGDWTARYWGYTYKKSGSNWVSYTAKTRTLGTGNNSGTTFNAPSNSSAATDTPWTWGSANGNMSQYGATQYYPGTTMRLWKSPTWTDGSYRGVTWKSRTITLTAVPNLVAWATKNTSQTETIPPQKCWELAHIASEYSSSKLAGPVRSNDSLRICGSMGFGRKPADQIMTAAPSGSDFRATKDTTLGASGTARICPSGATTNKPQVSAIATGTTSTANATGSSTLGTWSNTQDPVYIPSDNSQLRAQATSTYTRTGLTYINLSGNQVQFGKSYDGTGSVKWETAISFPANGIIAVNSAGSNCYSQYLSYVPDATIKYGYDPSGTYTTSPNNKLVSREGCGIAVVSGTYSSSLTIAAQHDIVIRSSVTRTSTATTAVLGLVATDWVRIAHLVSASTQAACDQFQATGGASTVSGGTGTNETTAIGTTGTGVTQLAYNPSGIQIDASIVALNGSFMLDRWWCGATLGTLTVNGSIIQKYHGPVNIIRGDTATAPTAGYTTKAYTYDDTLRSYQPPGYEYLNIGGEGWTVKKQWEQMSG
ncbi:MAG: hypothetical protein QM679_06600 [Patulibacter sp.]